MMDTLLTARQLQELLQIDRVTIYRMLKDGRLHGFKVGGQWRFSRAEIEAWIRERQADLGVAESPVIAASEPIPPAQALPLSCVETIQDVFAEAMGVGAVTVAMDGTPLTPISNSCAFCTLVQATKAGRKRCTGSWQALVKGGVVCHAGLRCTGGQIEVREEAVALFCAGQFLEEPASNGGAADHLAALAKATDLDVGALRQAWRQVPVLDERQSQKLSHLVQRVARTFSEIGEERLELLGRLRRIAEITELS